MGKRKIIGLGTLLIILAAGVYFASENVITRWRRDYNVLLITIDTMRADHLGCYGYSQDTSPNLDQFPKDGRSLRLELRAHSDDRTLACIYSYVEVPAKVGLIEKWDGALTGSTPLVGDSQEPRLYDRGRR